MNFKHSHTLRLAMMLLALLLVSCKVGTPVGILEPDELEKLLYDYHVAMGIAETQEGDLAHNRYVMSNAVFKKYDITQAEFDSTMVWYSAHSEILKDIYQSLSVRFDNESKRLGISNSATTMYASLTSTGDTANIWTDKNTLFINTDYVNNLYTVVIKADSTFRHDDEFLLSFDNRFISKDYSNEGHAQLLVQYENGYVADHTTRVSGNYESSVRLSPHKNSEESNVKAIYVSFYLPYDEFKSSYTVWIVKSPSLIRFHKIEVAKNDTVVADTMSVVQEDTIVEATKEVDERRLSPSELKSSHASETQNNVVKIKKMRPAQPANRRKR